MTEQFGKDIGSYVERRYRELMARDIARRCRMESG
jgi:hypothetical protein